MPELATQQIAVVVLGAGRSGTSAITRGLQAIGVDLGPGLRGGDAKNPTGFFEDEALLALNQRLKRLLGIRGSSVRLIEAEEWRAAPVAALRDAAIATIRQRFAGRPLWGYKYGRTLRLLPLWLEVYAACGLDVRYVVALRNPLSVARSRARLDPRRGTQEQSDLEWLVNVVPYFRLAADRPLVVVDYDRLLADPARELERVAHALALPIGDATRTAIQAYAQEFLVAGLRHSQFTVDDLARAPRVNVLVRDAYRWLHRLATDEVDPRTAVPWDEWARLEQRVAELAPLLRHIDRIEQDYRRAQRHPLGPLQRAGRLWRRGRDR